MRRSRTLERFTGQNCDSATWYSTHTCSMLLRSNCENVFFFHLKFLLFMRPKHVWRSRMPDGVQCLFSPYQIKLFCILFYICQGLNNFLAHFWIFLLRFSQFEMNLFWACTGIDIDSAGVWAKNKLIFTSIKWRFNGTVSRDFQPLVFHQTIPPGPLIHMLKPFWILLRIRRDMIDFRTQKFFSGSPFKLIYFLVGGVGQFVNIYMFLIDIPHKWIVSRDRGGLLMVSIDR
jgi:hypothetical protein